MKPNTSHRKFTSAFPVPEADNMKKQATIEKAKTLLSKNTMYAGARENFAKAQLRNISKAFWMIQLLCFAALLWNISTAKDLNDIQILFLTIVPIMTFYILPELLKAQLYRTSETEAACFYSPAKVIAAKMVLISLSNILIIGASSLAFGFYHQLNIGELLCRGFVPFNISIALSVIVFNFIKINSPYAMLSISAVLTVALTQLRYTSFLLTDAWFGIFVGSVLFAVFTMAVTSVRFGQIKERCYEA